MKLKTSFCLLLFLPFLNPSFAHSPDLSSIMVYEQNGKTNLVIKSALTAFEEEIKYHFGANAYQTPEAFVELLVLYFKKSCVVVSNQDTLQFINPQIQLGHETTLFCELANMPEQIDSFYIKNALFRDMPNNLCELILHINGLPQKQYILDNRNNQEVKLYFKNAHWVVDEKGNTSAPNYFGFLWLPALIIMGLSAMLTIRKFRSRIGSAPLQPFS